MGDHATPREGDEFLYLARGNIYGDALGQSGVENKTIEWVGCLDTFSIFHETLSEASVFYSQLFNARCPFEDRSARTQALTSG